MGVGVSWPDVVLALAVGVIQVVGTTHFAAPHEPSARQVDALGLILLVATPAALVVRRRWPVQVFAVALAATVTYQALGYVAGPEWLGLIVAFVTVMLAGYRRTAVVGLFAAYVLALWLPPLAGTGHAPSLGLALGVPAWLLVLLGAAEWLRLRSLRVAESARLRHEEVRRRVSEERLAIARELHDVLAQNISLINVQAATTLFQLNGADDRAVRALATIKEVSHETLLALRSVLGALREDGDAPKTPAPSISRLDGLVGRAAALGVIVRVEQSGAIRPLPPGVDLAAYRILQEALTNVARHAETTTARAEVTYGDADLVMQVDNDGPLRAPFVPGTGIAGMTERATAVGGELQAGPRPGGGFRVRARLPLDGAR
jgi:signal transduction histidine kinase